MSGNVRLVRADRQPNHPCTSTGVSKSLDIAGGLRYNPAHDLAPLPHSQELRARHLWLLHCLRSGVSCGIYRQAETFMNNPFLQDAQARILCAATNLCGSTRYPGLAFNILYRRIG